MITYEEAIELVLKNAPAPELCDAELTTLPGMVLAEDIFSDIDMPPFDKAVMDGFAVVTSSINNVSALKMIGEAKAGSPFSGVVNVGEAVQIMTGAMLPKGADAVIRVEDAEESDGFVKLKTPARCGQDIHKRGCYISKGAMALSKGKTIDISDIAALASVGKHSVKVYRRPTVSVLSTGDELVDVRETPSHSQIRDVNLPMLVSMLARDGVEAQSLGIVPDDIGALRAAIRNGLASDILIMSGGVSAGKYDHVPELLALEGVEKIFHKVNIKPGKPIFFGRRNKTLVFGLPGNPVSAFIGYLLFVRPVILKMMGVHDPIQRMEKGVLQQDIERSDLRKEFIPVKIIHPPLSKGGRGDLTPITSAGSADVFCLSAADGFAVIEEGVSRLAKGAEMEFLKW